MVAAEQMGNEGVERIRAKVEGAIKNPDVRKAALDLFAYAIENADEERSDAWYVTEGQRSLKLWAGRLLAVKLTSTRLEISVMGPLSDEDRQALGAEARENEAWKFIPGGLYLVLPVDRAPVAMERLKGRFDQFVDAAMARVRTAVSLDPHVRDVVTYVSSAVGRELPQPVAGSVSEDEPEGDEESEPTAREPRPRGRAPIFEQGGRSIASLVSDIERGEIALPDIQRPFVWDDTSVRNLLDSLFLGFPVGTLVLWHPTQGREAHAVGSTTQALRAAALIIDGQQRLTSLYAVMRGIQVIGKDGTPRTIRIAFRPRDGKFEVADAANGKDPEFLPSITELWRPGAKTKGQIRREMLDKLKSTGRTIDDAYENAFEHNLERAHGLTDYRFPVVDIRKTAGNEEATDEDVADIFVRINNQGTRLGQADFVLTLLSVFHGALRDRIEQRAHDMSKDAVVPIDTQQLLRASCAVGFGRARMSAVYGYLRGIDPATGETNLAGRQERLDTLDRAADDCLNQITWRDYNLRVMHAGFVDPSLVASSNAVVNAYAFYVLGRRASVPKPKLEEIVSRWLFSSLLTARYSGSAESVFESDLARVRERMAAGPHGLAEALDATIAETITGDYWTHGVVGALETQRGRAPAALAFRAAQIVLGARALFSDQLLQNLLAPPGTAGRAASEGHHLFPKAWLQSNGVKDRRRINQVANIADTGWWENGFISAKSPREYVPQVRDTLRIDDGRWARMCAEHALSPNWHTMEYEAFLQDRRVRMAEVIRVAFRKLGGEADAAPLSPPWFLPGAEMVWRDIVETERALRTVVRAAYAGRFGAEAPQKIEAALGDKERESLTRALRARPAGADPLSVVDYLYLGQLPTLLFVPEIWQHVRDQVSPDKETKQKLRVAVDQIAPVRNEIAHVREVSPDRLQRAALACKDVLAMIRA